MSHNDRSRSSQGVPRPLGIGSRFIFVLVQEKTSRETGEENVTPIVDLKRAMDFFTIKKASEGENVKNVHSSSLFAAD